MQRKSAISLLFPNRRKVSSGTVTTLQASLAQFLATVGQTTEAVQAPGLTQFLPLLQSAVTSMSDEQIRDGREMMRSLVKALDNADIEATATETRPESDSRGSNGNGKDNPLPSTPTPV